MIIDYYKHYEIILGNKRIFIFDRTKESNRSNFKEFFSPYEAVKYLMNGG